jgi:hypothetical protein
MSERPKRDLDRPFALVSKWSVLALAFTWLLICRQRASRGAVLSVPTPVRRKDACCRDPFIGLSLTLLPAPIRADSRHMELLFL